jgi:hypothetical protein
MDSREAGAVKPRRLVHPLNAAVPMVFRVVCETKVMEESPTQFSKAESPASVTEVGMDTELRS